MWATRGSCGCGSDSGTVVGWGPSTAAAEAASGGEQAGIRRKRRVLGDLPRQTHAAVSWEGQLHRRKQRQHECRVEADVAVTFRPYVPLSLAAAGVLFAAWLTCVCTLALWRLLGCAQRNRDQLANQTLCTSHSCPHDRVWPAVMSECRTLPKAVKGMPPHHGAPRQTLGTRLDRGCRLSSNSKSR